MGKALDHEMLLPSAVVQFVGRDKWGPNPAGALTMLHDKPHKDLPKAFVGPLGHTWRAPRSQTCMKLFPRSSTGVIFLTVFKGQSMGFVMRKDKLSPGRDTKNDPVTNGLLHLFSSKG